MEILTKVLRVCSTDCGVYAKIGKVFPTNSLADHLGSNVNAIVYNPGITLAVICGIHLVIDILVLPFHLISYIITVPGAWFVFGGVIVYLCRFFARCLMFPGALLPVQRNVAKEILRGVAMQSSSIGKAVQEQASSIHMTARTGAMPLKFSTEELEEVCDIHIPRLLLLLGTGADDDRDCSEEERGIYESLTPETLQPLVNLRTTLGNLQTAFHALLALFFLDDSNIESSVPGDERFKLLVKVDPTTGKRVGKRLSLKSLLMSDARRDLLKRSAMVAQTCHFVRMAASALINPKGDNSDDGAENSPSAAYLADVKNGLRDFFYGCQGLELLAFLIMRKQISVMYQLSSPSVNTNNNRSLSSNSVLSDKKSYFQKDDDVTDNLHDESTTSPVRLHTFEQNMKSKSAVERFSLVAASDCKTDCTDTASPTIDGILVFGRHDAPIDTFTVHETKSPHQQLPIVLYCPPNAGFYECIGMAPVDSNWVGVYTQLVGLDVCIFNYRGYANSTGTPDPTAIKSDGLTVARYLLDRFPNRGIIVHGESIGGMVACHVAMKIYSDPGNLLRGLVCDKSFSSLNAVSRRMLGNWAGPSLALLGRWDIDSLENYCAVNADSNDEDNITTSKKKAFKVIMQDPDDEIIHHASSMKVGLAAKYLMGEDGTQPKMHLNSQYVIAEAKGHDVPSAAEVTGLTYSPSLLASTEDKTQGTSVYCTDQKQWETRILLLLNHPYLPLCVFSQHGIHSSGSANDNINSGSSGGYNGNYNSVIDLNDNNINSVIDSQPLISEAFVQHFAACVISLARTAAVAAKKQQNKGKKDNNSLTVDTEKAEEEPSEDDSSGFGHGVSVLGTTSDSEESSGEDEDDQQQEQENKASNNNSGGDTQHAPDCQCGRPHPPTTTSKNKFVQLEQFCSQSIAPPSAHSDSADAGANLSWEERVWVALSRTEAGAGVLLGSSVKGGADKIKAWVLSAVMWGHESTSVPFIAPATTVLPPSRTTFWEASRDLSTLLQERMEDKSIRSGDGTILTPHSAYNVSSSQPDIEAPATTSPQTDFEGVDDRILFLIRALQALHYRQIAVEAEVSSKTHSPASDSEGDLEAEVTTRLLDGSGTSVFGTTGAPPKPIADIGCLLSVHNGHNGWLGKTGLHQYLKHIVDKIIRVSREESLGSGSGDGSLGTAAY